MGAKIKLEEHVAIVQGVGSLCGTQVRASDLRASVCLVIAGLAAEGTTKISHIHHLNRGYENLEEKLQACGADITRIKINS